MVFMSSPKHIKELDGTPDDVLSLNGAAKHVRVVSKRYLQALLTISCRCYSLCTP